MYTQASSSSACTSPGTGLGPGESSPQASAGPVARITIAVSGQSCRHHLLTNGIEEGGARMPATPLCRPGTAGQKGQQVPEGPDRWASGAGSARTKVRLGQGPGASAHVLTASSRTLNRDDARMCAATAGRQSAYLGSRFTQIFLSPFSMLGSAEQRVRRLADGSPDTGGHVVRWRRRGGGLGLPVTMSAMATPLFPVCSLVSQTVTFDHMVFKSSVL